MNGRDQLAVGAGALARGDWAAARDAFEASWGADETPEALDGLGRAQWWLDEPAMALDMRSRAFAFFRRDHRDLAAAHIAVWLARQYRSLYRRHGMADGWLARARSLWSELEDGGSLSGWILLAESETDAPRRTDPDRAGAALAIARDRHDIDLEIVALSRRGAGKAIAGDVAAGVSDLNEAMAAATSGEGHDVQYLGEALCTLLEVSGWLGDAGLVEPWAQILVDFRASYAFGPLVPFAGTSAPELISAFCTGCCGGVYLVTGRLDAAEEQLVRGAAQLTMTGLRPRCLHPVAQLVELRILQGRLAEAEGVLTGFESDWECATAVASLDLAKHRPARAVAVLSSTLETLNDAPVLALPLQAQLVDAALAADDLALARLMARVITTTAETTGTVLHRAHGELARGKIAAADGDDGASGLLRAAALKFAEAGSPLPASRARVALARCLATRDRGVAVTEARSALLAFERMGAKADADRTAAFLRELGDRGRAGPRDVGLLSRREREVLALVAEGLSNAEIAERLVISVKTAGHHVSSILAKLGLRSRTEAAAFALLRLPARSPERASPGKWAAE